MKFRDMFIASSASLLTLAACDGNSFHANDLSLCGSGPGEITGNEIVFEGGPELPVCEVNASALMPTFNSKAIDYTFSRGRLVINGDIQSHVDIYANDAQVIVNGNISTNAAINVTSPTAQSIVQRESLCFLGPYPVQKCTVDEEVITGFSFPEDTTPSLTVNGNIARDAILISNKDILVNGYSCSDQISAPQSAVVTQGFPANNSTYTCRF